MGTATVALFQQGKVSWKTAKDSYTTDWEALAGEHPELVASYPATKPGSRRFNVKTTS